MLAGSFSRKAVNMRFARNMHNAHLKNMLDEESMMVIGFCFGGATAMCCGMGMTYEKQSVAKGIIIVPAMTTVGCFSGVILGAFWRFWLPLGCVGAIVSGVGKIKAGKKLTE